MKALIYERPWLKYDFILVSEYEPLIKAYTDIYKCKIYEIYTDIFADRHEILRRTASAEQLLEGICELLADRHSKSFYCAFYEQNSSFVFYMQHKNNGVHDGINSSINNNENSGVHSSINSDENCGIHSCINSSENNGVHSVVNKICLANNSPDTDSKNSFDSENSFIRAEQNAIKTESIIQIIKIIQIIENIMYMCIEPEDGILALHGAAVAAGEKALIIPASTTSGKSTLTAFLTLMGYDYITDDEIYISCAELKVRYAYKPPLLRKGGCNVIRNAMGEDALKNAKRVMCGTEERYMLSNMINSEEAQTEAAQTYDFNKSYYIAAVVLLKGYASTSPHIRKMSTYEAFPELLKSQLAPCSEKNIQSISARYRAIAELSKKTYEMEYSDLWTAENYLKHLLK